MNTREYLYEFFTGGLMPSDMAIGIILFATTVFLLTALFRIAKELLW